MSRASKVDLRLTSNAGYEPGRSYIVRATWLVVETLAFVNPLVTSYRVKRVLLRLFGASVGTDVIIKPGVHVKYPWRLTIGDHAWIGERAWIDNMEDVLIGAHAVVSQGAYLCTGNHDWSHPGMPLAPQPIVIEDGAWIGAFARIAPGVRVAVDSVAALGAVVLDDTESSAVYAGNPATRIGDRMVEP